jgi:hypothetical protein
MGKEIVMLPANAPAAVSRLVRTVISSGCAVPT